MKGDFTRSTFRREKHYSSVRLQQGRVTLDADWNEAHDIVADRIETEALDVIGACGAPLHCSGFHVVTAATELTAEEQHLEGNSNPPSGATLLISAGRYYVDGVLCRNERIIAIAQQDDALPKGAQAPLLQAADGSVGRLTLARGATYFAFLDVWQRHLTALEDDLTREKALGGPDTATRLKTVWQVKLLQVPTGSGCTAEPEAWKKLLAPPTGRIEARAKSGEPSDNPCSIAPGAGFRRLENQLYRVEIHQGGDLNSATFKWSRDNGSLVTKWLGPGKHVNELQVESIGRDQPTRFAPGQWVELIDDERELQGKPGVMVRLANAEGDVLTIEDPTDPANAIPAGAINFTDFRTNPKVRRWDSAGTPTVQRGALDNDEYLKLEDGVEVRFSSGSYRSGDYWMIPARTATGNVEWPFIAPVAPQGIAHHYCKLATVDVAADGSLKVGDCREIFAPLTEIERRGDVKKHNHHLHGWGVVCGLQVHCRGGDRTSVSIAPGYALACDGSDIDVDGTNSFPVIEAARAKKLLHGTSGEVCLTLRNLPQNRFAFDVIADSDAELTFWERVLKGTLLKDLYDDCLKPLIKLVLHELVNDDPNDKRLVGEATRNRIALVNALAQLVNQSSGRHVFLSSDEHRRLEAMFELILKQLSSPTFCALTDDLPEFPKYPFEDLNKRGLTTIYGKATHGRLRVNGALKLAYSFGTPQERKVCIYDLEEGELKAVIELAAVGGMQLTVQDIAVLNEHIIIAATDAASTALFDYDARGQNQIREPVVVPGIRIVRMERAPADKTVYAIGRGKGLFRFEADNFSVDSFAKPVADFNATGHLALTGTQKQPIAIATSSSTNQETSTYDTLELVGGGSKSVPLRDSRGEAAYGSDGLGVILNPAAAAEGNAASGPFAAIQRAGRAIYVAADPAAGGADKRLLLFAGGSENATAEVELPTQGEIALMASPAQEFMMVAMSDQFRMLWVDPRSNELQAAHTFPLQIAPAALGVAATGSSPQVIALNRGSQTLTRIPGEFIAAKSPLDTQELRHYRAAVVAALSDALARLAQRIKDCACEHLLLDCPVCDPNDPLIIASIEIRNNRVFQICNLRRREVLTFPKLAYWLSAIPALPLIRELVEVFCCTPLPGLMHQFLANPGDIIAPRTLAGGLALFDPTYFARVQTKLKNRLALLEKLVLGQVQPQFILQSTSGSMLQSESIIDTSAASATKYLDSLGAAVVSVAPLESAIAAGTLKSIGDLPLTVNPGDKINLYTENDKVVFFTRAAAPIPTAAPMTAEPANISEELARLKSEMTASQQARDDALAARDKEIASLRTELEEVKKLVASPEKPAGGSTRKPK